MIFVPDDGEVVPLRLYLVSEYGTQDRVVRTAAEFANRGLFVVKRREEVRVLAHRETPFESFRFSNRALAFDQRKSNGP